MHRQGLPLAARLWGDTKVQAHGILGKSGLPAGYRDAEWEIMCSGGALERPGTSCMVTDLCRGIGQGEHVVKSK